jgi:hypothetical protein
VIYSHEIDNGTLGNPFLLHSADQIAHGLDAINVTYDIVISF